jgi:hypothetical protein
MFAPIVNHALRILLLRIVNDWHCKLRMENKAWMQIMVIHTNVEIGILTKVNELALRYGLDPTDFVAEYKSEYAPEPALGGKLDVTGRSVLNYTIPPNQPSKLERFERMLDTLGTNEGSLIATDSEIMQALNKALELAPRARARPQI